MSYSQKHPKSMLVNEKQLKQFPYRMCKPKSYSRKNKFSLSEPKVVPVSVANSWNNNKTKYNFMFGGSVFEAAMTRRSNCKYIAYKLPGTKIIVVAKDNYNEDRPYEKDYGFAFERLLTKSGTKIISY